MGEHGKLRRATSPEAVGSNQRGSSMILAVFVLALISAMGGALLFTTQVEVQMSQGDVRAKQVFYLAEAGEESAREALFVLNGIDDLSDELVAAAGPNGRIDFDPDALTPVRDGAGRVVGFTGYGDDVPLAALTALGDGVFMAFLTNDPVEGATNLSDANRLVTITSAGGGANGSTEIVQAVVTPDRPLPEMPAAAITLLGPDPVFEGGTSNPSNYEGRDCGGAGIPGLTVPIVGTTGDEERLDAIDGIWDKNGPEYESGTLEGADTVADMTDPDDPALLASNLGTLGEEWTDCLALHDLVEKLRENATWRCENRGDVIVVTDADGERTATGNDCRLPQGSRPGDILFVDGNVAISRTTSGAGLVIATGELLIHGKASWSGAVLAIGEGLLVRYGAGNGGVSGAIVVADIAGADEIYGTDDDCGADNGLGSPEYRVDGGGTGSTTYCSIDLELANPPLPYDIVSFRQG